MENSNWKTVHAFSLIGCSSYLLMNATVPQVHDFMYSLSESVAKQLEDCTNIFKILVQIVIGTDSVITRTDIKLISVLVITLSVSDLLQNCALFFECLCLNQRSLNVKTTDFILFKPMPLDSLVHTL